MHIELNGKNALVCGSTQGIGKASAVLMAQLGANVTLLARNEVALRQVAGQLQKSDEQQHGYLVADFSDPNQVDQVLAKFVEDNDIHILVNNTGGPPGGLISEASPWAFQEAFAQHLICNHIITQHIIAGMKRAQYGRIINIISTSVKAPIPGLGVSNTTRGAVANWAKTLSVELGPFGITVNNVLPGATSTARLESIIQAKADKENRPYDEIAEAMRNQVPAQRFAAPEEVANAVAFLAGEAAAYINGTNLPVDGGRTPCL